MMLSDILSAALLTGCFTSWVVLLLRKIGVIAWMQSHGNDFVYQLASCSYCLNWWLGLMVVVVMLVLTGEYSLLVVPFLSTPIGRILSM